MTSGWVFPHTKKNNLFPKVSFVTSSVHVYFTGAFQIHLYMYIYIYAIEKLYHQTIFCLTGLRF
jgi:hypothetical protein